MATVLFEGVFDQILLRTAKMTVFEALFQICASPSRTFSGELDFLKLSTGFLFIELGFAKI